MSRGGESGRAGFNSFGLAHGVRKVSNQLAFLAHTSPAVPLHRDFPTGQRYFLLDDLWNAFDEPSAFGCEIPLELRSDDGVGSAVTQCYVPYLSALQLFDSDRRCLHTRCCDDGSDEDTSQESTSSDAQSISSSSTGSDEDKLGTSNFGLGSRHQPLAGRRQLLFEFQETAIPHMREPLTDRVHRLGMPCGLRSCDLHPHSWFAVAWYPLYRIPSGRCLRELSASFLTFHSLSPPPAASQNLSRLPSRIAAPIFPYRGGPGDKHVMAQKQAPLAHPAVAACLAPVLEERRRAAGALAVPDALTFLTPFGFVAHKAKGRTWADSELAACVQATMGAAAIAWTQQMSCKHPDLEFFARNLKSNISHPRMMGQ